MTGADAGSVYVVEEEGGSQAEYKPAPKKFLHFMLSQNDSIKIDFKEFVLDIDDKSIVGQAVLSKHPINIPDLSQLEHEPEDEDAASQPQLRRQDRLPRAVDADGADAVRGRRGDRRRAADQQAPGSRPPARDATAT